MAAAAPACIDALVDLPVERAAPGVLADFRIDLGIKRGAHLRWIDSRDRLHLHLRDHDPLGRKLLLDLRQPHLLQAVHGGAADAESQHCFEDKTHGALAFCVRAA